jgi:hypothetical protein
VILIQYPGESLGWQGEGQELHLVPAPLDIRNNLVYAGIKSRLAVQIYQYQVINGIHGLSLGPLTDGLHQSIKNPKKFKERGLKGLGVRHSRALSTSDPAPFLRRDDSHDWHEGSGIH